MMTTGNYERSGHAKYFAAGADQSSSIAGSHEEPDGAEQDCEAHQCWYYQDAVRRARGAACMVCVGPLSFGVKYEVRNGQGRTRKELRACQFSCKEMRFALLTINQRGFYFFIFICVSCSTCTI